MKDAESQRERESERDVTERQRETKIEPKTDSAIS